MPRPHHVGVSKSVLIINGHPDGRPERFCAALADAYDRGARSAGCETRRLNLDDIEVPLLTSREAYEGANPPAAISLAQRQILWADHVVMVFPLWLGTMPAALKALLEQTLRPEFAFGPKGFGDGRLKGRSARVIVTMGMPALIYRLVFGAHGVLGLEQGILKLVGCSPVRHLLIGGVETPRAAQRAHWLRAVEQLDERCV